MARKNRLEVTKKVVGKKKDTLYYPPIVSISRHENGFSIKPLNQPRVYISYLAAEYIAEMVRNKRRLFTYEEAQDIFIYESAQALDDKDRPEKIESINAMRLKRDR